VGGAKPLGVWGRAPIATDPVRWAAAIGETSRGIAGIDGMRLMVVLSIHGDLAKRRTGGSGPSTRARRQQRDGHAHARRRGVGRHGLSAARARQADRHRAAGILEYVVEQQPERPHPLGDRDAELEQEPADAVDAGGAVFLET
jgi:hypothetical protein